MRSIAGGLLAVAALVTATAAVAQREFPERNISVIVPFPPGGASDITARLVTTKLAERLKQTVVIDNRAGANGALGAQAMRQAAPDGYTLLVGSIGVFAINPALYKNLRYDPQKDFDLLSQVVRTPNVLVASPSFPANSVGELIEHLKKNPGKVTFASSGTGSSDHLTAALFWQKTGTSGIHVPYKGGGPAINDLIAGHANVSFQNLGAISQHVKSGRLKALAVTSDWPRRDLAGRPLDGGGGRQGSRRLFVAGRGGARRASAGGQGEARGRAGRVRECRGHQGEVRGDRLRRGRQQWRAIREIPRGRDRALEIGGRDRQHHRGVRPAAKPGQGVYSQIRAVCCTLESGRGNGHSMSSRWAILGTPEPQRLRKQTKKRAR